MWRRVRLGCLVPVDLDRAVKEVCVGSKEARNSLERAQVADASHAIFHSRPQGIDERLLILFQLEQQQQQQRRRRRIPTVHPSTTRIQILVVRDQGDLVGAGVDDDEGDGYPGLLAHLVGLLFHVVRVDHEEADSVSRRLMLKTSCSCLFGLIRGGITLQAHDQVPIHSV
jgi:hypothetical protein